MKKAKEDVLKHLEYFHKTLGDYNVIFDSDEEIDHLLSQRIIVRDLIEYLKEKQSWF